MLKSVNGATFTRIVNCAAAVIRPGCAGSVLPVPMPGSTKVPVTRPVLLCVRLNDAPARRPTVTFQLPVIVPTVNDRVSVAVAPLLSATVRRAVPLPPLVNVMLPLLPAKGLPATSHEYVIASPSGSDADELNAN